MNYFNDHFLPVDFSEPVVIERYLILGYHPAVRHACSTPRALVELQPIIAELKVPRDYSKHVSTNADPVDDPLVGVKLAFDHLRTVLELSEKYKLPAVFWG
jgi:hypothetical protein